VRDSKYVVFKRDDYVNWFNSFPERAMPNGPGPYALEDAVVIRRQDVFAPPALDAYANSIRVALSMAMPSDEAGINIAARLAEIADYFHEQATLSWDTERKLPD